jgi:pimeloyl-ACP methyl ester carboxylesterase
LKDGEPQFRPVGADGRRIAFRRRAALGAGAPGVVWLGGFKSDMDSTKASALDAHCERTGRAFLRFDYSGHGLSGGDFELGTVSRWLEEASAMIRNETEGGQVIVGSSMGGYLALLLAREFFALGETSRLEGFVLIAPAVDFTEALLWASLPDEARREIEARGVWRRPSAYSAQPYVFTRALIEDGRRHLLMGGLIRSHAPVRILQGRLDPDVPYTHALKLMERLAEDEATLTLIRDGDHRLSRPQDLELLLQAVDDMRA